MNIKLLAKNITRNKLYGIKSIFNYDFLENPISISVMNLIELKESHVQFRYLK